MVARGVRRAQPSLELVLEARAQVVGQRLQGRARPGAGDPGEDGVLAGEDVQVGRLPRVDGAAEGGERVEVRRGVVAGGHRDVARVLGVRRLGGEVATDRVAGLVEVAGDLEREPPAGLHAGHEVRKEPEVAGDPLEGGVGDEDVHPGRGRGSGPVAQVGDVEGDPVVGGAGLRDHLGAGVQAVDRGVGPAVGEEGGQVAGAAAEVDDGAGVGGRDPGDQLDERPAALVGVGEVAVGVPAVGHGSSSSPSVLPSWSSIASLDVKIVRSCRPMCLDVKILDRAR